MSDLCAYIWLCAAISVWFVYYILVYIELHRGCKNDKRKKKSKKKPLD